jgi:hypothetical protein
MGSPTKGFLEKKKFKSPYLKKKKTLEVVRFRSRHTLKQKMKMKTDKIKIGKI